MFSTWVVSQLLPILPKKVRQTGASVSEDHGAPWMSCFELVELATGLRSHAGTYKVVPPKL